MNKKESHFRARRSLFWSVSENNLSNVSDELLVENILNYGSLEDVRQLFLVLGLTRTAEVFRKTCVGRARHNYFPQVANFFKLYFDRHAPVAFHV